MLIPNNTILTGDIIDMDTGSTIANAEIVFMNEYDTSTVWTAVSDAGGVYRIVLNSCGEDYILKVKHPDYKNFYEDDITIDCFVENEVYAEMESADVIDPVILVPGILGSWNLTELKFLLFSEDGIGGLAEKVFPWMDEWYPDPLLGTYTDFIKIFDEQDVYTEGDNFFVFTYDWRESNMINARLLKDKIQEVLIKTGASKVDIVAHSMGGLITRYYISSDLYRHDVDQVVFLGTPHRGAPKSYLTWEGGYLGVDILGISSEIIFKHVAKSSGYGSIFDFVRKYPVVSVQQLLPDYTYLYDAGSGQEIVYTPQSDDYPQNNFLVYLNKPENIDKFTDRVRRTVIIYGEQQDETITGYQITKSHSENPKWEHGKPAGFTSLSRENGVLIGMGDETVPVNSLQDFPAVKTIVNSNADHNTIVKKSIDDVYLELTGRRLYIPADYKYIPDFESYMILTMASPLDIQIVSPDGSRVGYDHETETILQEVSYAYYTGPNTHPEFILIPNPQEGEYVVKAKTTGAGDYKLSVDYISGETFTQKSIEGMVYGEGEDLEYYFEMDTEKDDPISDISVDDMTPPVIDIYSPIDGAYYLHSDVVDVDIDVYDGDMGLKEYKVYLDDQDITGQDSIDLFYLENGNYVLKVEAEDKAGNKSDKEVYFSVYATIDSFIKDTERAYDEGMIKNKTAFKTIKTQAKVIKKIKSILKTPFISRFMTDKTAKSIKKMYNNISKQLNRFYRLKMINKQGYTILKNQIKYLRNNI